MITADVENYPGFADVIQGPWLMEQMQKQAEHVGAQMVFDPIVEDDLPRRPFRLIGDSDTVYVGDTLVIATGARSEEHTSELQSLMCSSYAGSCLKKYNNI